jgi:chemosensory pili system protein ChpA (sensor histidine kinase/response regulator)
MSWLAEIWQRLRSRGRGGSGEDIDPDVRDIFLAELDEVTATLGELLPAWRTRRNDPATLQNIRRGFHTLKGSGLTAGARNLGVFCGGIEKLTLQLIERRSTPLPGAIAAIEDAIGVLPACSRSIRDSTPMPAEFHELAQSVRRLLGI